MYIISHKTAYASQDETGTDLRTSALSWMKEWRFFEKDGLGLTPDDIHFEPTRSQKIDRIRKLKCTHFIDDLEETFLEADFPAGIEKILFAPQVHSPSILEGVRVATSWAEIKDWVFGTSPS